MVDRHCFITSGVPDAPLPGLLPCPWPDMVPDDLVVLLLPLGVQVLTAPRGLVLVHSGGVLLDHLLGLGGALLVLVTPRALALVLAPRPWPRSYRPPPWCA